MGRLLERERRRLIAFKADSPYFSEGARADGVYKKKPRPFCLPNEYAEENLFSEIREAAMEYFAGQGIVWHEGQGGKPSTHLCSSQVCCVNFLFPFADRPGALVELLRPVFPGIRRVLPMEKEGQFVSFEWIGKENYLREKEPRSGARTRGANCTSADAAVMFEREDGLRQIALIEWKYTETYGGARPGTDRQKAIYTHLYERDDFPLDKSLLPGFGALFYEPFYQLFRQQSLAHEMERAGELGAQVVSLLHIEPACNDEFLVVTSPELRTLGDSVIEVWKKLVRNPGRFANVAVEEMFGQFPVDEFPGLGAWWEYIAARYPWVQSGK